ncbi:hypothetical protein PaeCFBP13512_22195 [Paenibacillus sp. CFBP13512]|uniref:hypothetical protein n=1 Tax=Paenibacillus sp. CFBP13512 TaxID=2184007 RepID=UPI0010C14C6B|nr:hypothetical protein [Paenibacillus sp. CFBP13512]TKJ83834.1 hypothetical protein PaeCFBP13512_22195 [Paenibacillus sp. CFBP13512]
MNKSPKTMLIDRMHKKEVAENKRHLIFNEMSPLEERGWEIVRSNVRVKLYDIKEVYVLLCRNQKEPVLLLFSVSPGAFVSQRRIEHHTVNYLNAFYQQFESMPLHIFTCEFSTNSESDIPLESYNHRWQNLSSRSWLESFYHIIQYQKELPSELDDLSLMTHPDFDAYVRNRVAFCYQEWHGLNAGTLQIRIYLEQGDPQEHWSPTDVQHFLEYGDETPKLVIDIGGADPALHPVITMYFDLWHGTFGDHIWDAHQLWEDFHKFVQ